MSSVPQFTPPRTPFQSLHFNQLLPSSQHSAKLPSQSSSPPCLPSSPLNPYSSGKAQRFVSSSMSFNAPTNRRASYKSRRPAYTLAPAPDPPRNAFLRDKIKAKCADRIAKDRTKMLEGKKKKYQSSSSDAGGSSDVDMDDEEGEGDEVDDPMFLRVMTAEMNRERHREHYLHERQVGSSFDPDMEDMDEWEEPSNLPDDEDYDDEDLVADYEAYLEAQAEQDELKPETEPIITSSQSTILVSAADESRNHFLNHLLSSPCPQCQQAPLAIAPDVEAAVTCSHCRTTFPLKDTAASWVEDHPSVDHVHRPMWSLDPFDPSAILFQCSSSDCIWLSSL